MTYGLCKCDCSTRLALGSANCFLIGAGARKPFLDKELSCNLGGLNG